MLTQLLNANRNIKSKFKSRVYQVNPPQQEQRGLTKQAYLLDRLISSFLYQLSTTSASISIPLNCMEQYTWTKSLMSLKMICIYWFVLIEDLRLIWNYFFLFFLFFWFFFIFSIFEILKSELKRKLVKAIFEIRREFRREIKLRLIDIS